MATLDHVYLIMILRLADNLMKRNVKRPRKLGPTCYYYTKKICQKRVCKNTVAHLTSLGGQQLVVLNTNYYSTILKLLSLCEIFTAKLLTSGFGIKHN